MSAARSMASSRVSVCTGVWCRTADRFVPRWPSASEAGADSPCRGLDRLAQGRAPGGVARSGKSIRRPMEVHGRDDLAARVGDGRGHRVDADRELLADPGVAIALDVAEPGSKLARVGHGVLGEP